MKTISSEYGSSVENINLKKTDNPELLHDAIKQASIALLKLQHQDGYWHFDLEADCTITAEYILMMHYMDEIDSDLEKKLAIYLRGKQTYEGGWSLYYGGKPDLSCTIKVYYALKLVGDDPESEHMIRARELVLKMGGAARSNVFTRITLALFQQVPWRAVPFIPVEIMLLPKWFPFHLSKVSYWSRVVMVPLFILCTLKPKAKNPRQIHIPELFTTPPHQEHNYFPIRSLMNCFFQVLDKLGRCIEPFIPKSVRQKAIKKAEQWFTDRLNGEDGLGAIFPAMVAGYQSLNLLNYSADHPYCVQSRNALQKLLVVKPEFAYCQPSLSPIWDTALSCLALEEADQSAYKQAIQSALDWVAKRQITEGPADWREYRPNLQPGGWAFEFNNQHYPDLDDTAAIAWAMHNYIDAERYTKNINQAVTWLVGMQSRNNGFAAFDADNTYYYLNEIPFADHGALLDPPTSDVSARCVTLLAYLQNPQYKNQLKKCIRFLYKNQEKDGSWFGRWGTNYIYGTWSVLTALSAANEDINSPAIRAAVVWLKNRQNNDGGWGESNDCYYNAKNFYQESNSCQTAWALLGLMAVGEVKSLEVKKGIHYLLQTQQANGLWIDPWFNAPGFPRVFYLKYHGYNKFFPLWALAKYRNLIDFPFMAAQADI